MFVILANSVAVNPLFSIKFFLNACFLSEEHRNLVLSDEILIFCLTLGGA